MHANPVMFEKISNQMHIFLQSFSKARKKFQSGCFNHISFHNALDYMVNNIHLETCRKHADYLPLWLSTLCSTSLGYTTGSTFPYMSRTFMKTVTIYRLLFPTILTPNLVSTLTSFPLLF